MALRKFIGTFIGCASMLLLTLPTHGGFLIYAFLIFLIPLSLNSVYRIYRHREETKLRSGKLLIWAFTILVSVSFNYYRHIDTRSSANAIVKAIEDYRSESGEYPETLDSIGLSQQQLSERLGKSGYSFDNAEPLLFYAVTYTTSRVYSYQ